MRQSFKEDVVERLKAEPDATFERSDVKKDDILSDQDKLERLWASYQKSIEDYDVDAAYAYGDAMRELFGIMVEGWAP